MSMSMFADSAYSKSVSFRLRKQDELTATKTDARPVVAPRLAAKFKPMYDRRFQLLTGLAVFDHRPSSR